MSKQPGNTARSGKVVIAAAMHRESECVVDTLELLGIGQDRQRVFHSDDMSVAEAVERGAEAVAGAAGLVLCGGGDVAPRRYGEEPLPWVRISIQKGRDEMEWAMLDAAREHNVPVWGICRGFQTLNVYLGGTLWQDLPTQVSNTLAHHLSSPRDALIHDVEVTPEGRGSGLGEVLARERCLVNSRHHQAIRELADGLVPVARSADGVVEAVLLADGDWWLEGVEWHPENLMPLPQQRAVAQRFADAVERRSTH